MAHDNQLTRDDVLAYDLVDPERPYIWSAQVTELATELSRLVDDVLTNGEPDCTVATALDVALEEIPRVDTLAYRETLKAAVTRVSEERGL